MCSHFWGEEHSLPVCFPNDACMPYLPTCGLKLMVNVGKSSIHGAIGFDLQAKGVENVIRFSCLPNLRAKYPPGKSEGEE